MAWAAKRSLGIALLVAVTALTAVTAYDNEIGPAGYTDVRDSPCFPCHVTWDPPLKDFITLVPATDVSGEVGEQIEYPVLIQNAWISDLIRFEPSLDISNAPSLGFVTEIPPDLGRAYQGTIPAADPSAGSIGARSAHVLVPVEAGVTDIKITLEPVNRNPLTAPDLTLNIYTQTEEPSGQPDETVDENGVGEAEVFHGVGGSVLSELGFGTWAIEAEVPGATSGGPGSLAEVPFTVVVDKYYNSTEETVQFQQRDELVTPGGSTLFTWTLQVRDTPGADEELKVAANVTSYYVHDDSSTEDIGYTHTAMDVPVVAGPTGGVGFDTGGSTVVVVTAPKVGVSMSRISEIVGYVSAILVLASIYTGGMFGKKSRRQLNSVFQTARRRVAFHNFISYGIILAAFVHTLIFLIPGIEGNYHWTQGLIWGSIAILAMFGLGITGALQVPLIRRFNYAAWRWTHFGLSIAVIVFTIVHILLDGGNFGSVQDAVNWSNPLDTR